MKVLEWFDIYGKYSYNINMKRKFITPLILSLVNICLAVFLVWFGTRIYQQWQDQDYQLRLNRVMSEGTSLGISKDSRSHSGLIGDSYVTVYYPQADGQDIAYVKERLDSETEAMAAAKPQISQDIQSVVYYGTQMASSQLNDLERMSIEKREYKIENRKVGKMISSQVSSFYLKDGQPVTLSQLFQNPEVAKESLLSFMKQQLTFRGLDENLVQETLTQLVNSDMATWSFSYQDGQFSIYFNPAIEDVNKVDIPLSEVYSSIDPSYLQGDDLKNYQAYEEQKNRKMVALTFDDGPNPTTTPQALDILKKYKAKATFFMVGQSVAGNEAIIQRVVKEGHEIGNHTWDHPVLTKLDLSQAQAEINNTTAALKQASGQDIKITRPPYGAINSSIQAAVDQSFILWDIDSLDWKTHNTAAIMEEVKKAQSGSIILMHDIHQTTIDALPTVIQYLQAQGFSLVTVDELMHHKLDTHRAYFSAN